MSYQIELLMVFFLSALLLFGLRRTGSIRGVRVQAVVVALIPLLSSCASGSGDAVPEVVDITRMPSDRYYSVTIDFTKKVSHRDIGVQYGRDVVQLVPDYDDIVTSYIDELMDIAASHLPVKWKWFAYQYFLLKIEMMKANLPREYRDEIEGFASVAFKGNSDLSAVSKAYMINLLPDIARGNTCSAFSVTGERSATGKTTTIRLLDWYGGTKYQMSRVQAVTRMQKSGKTIYTVGYLGMLGVITGLNSDGVFGAILDSETKDWAAIIYGNEHSYNQELRYGLENFNTIEEVEKHITDASKYYTFSYLIYLSDADKSQVVENETAPLGDTKKIRTDMSPLSPSAKGMWHPIPSVVPAVNCFMLEGMKENCTEAANKNRLDTMLTNYLDVIGKFSVADVKKVMINPPRGAKPGPGDMEAGYVYNDKTQQIIVYQPASNTLEVAFAPIGGPLPETPEFVTIPLDFGRDVK